MYSGTLTFQINNFIYIYMYKRRQRKEKLLKMLKQTKFSVLPPEYCIHKDNCVYLKKQDRNGICDRCWQKYLYLNLEKYKS